MVRDHMKQLQSHQYGEIARQMQLSEREEEYEAGVRWFKTIR